MSLDLPALEAFAAFAEHLNFTHAARAIHLSQPALYARVRRLADDVGAPLYRRSGRQLALTDTGRRVARFAREMQRRCETFDDELALRVREAPVRLAAGEGAFLYLLAPALRRVRRHGVSLRLTVRDVEGTRRALETGEVDVGVAPLQRPLDDFECEPIAEIPLVAAVPNHHPLADRATVRVRDLGPFPLVVPPPGGPHRRVLDHAFVRAGIAPQIAVETTGWPLTLQFVALGVGLAVVNGFCRMPRGTVAVPMTAMAPVRYWAVRPSQPPPSGPAARLWAALTGLGG